MEKAQREAKVFTSWLNPSEVHERAMRRFIEIALAPDNAAFRADFLAFQRRVATYGICNSLAQLAIKIGGPGVPDFYQGTEIWDFSLVDPDNRRPVDYEYRRSLLDGLDEALRERDPAAVAAELIASPCDDRLKLYTTSALLRFRRAHLALFQLGAYDPLPIGGSRREHIFAFARSRGIRSAVLAVPRLPATLLSGSNALPLGEPVWGDTTIDAPPAGPASYRHVLTGDTICARQIDGRRAFRAADVFATFPIAMLEPR
jgi:(1->4)-alpha-D-glucan 1-alpha-D-glucosylmutase